MIDAQPWKPPYEIVEVPQDMARLCFPANYFSATIIGDHIQLSISTDAAALPAVIRRLEKLVEFARLGPMPQARHVPWPREMVAGDIAASGIETEGHDAEERHGAEHESPTAEGGDAQ